MTIQAVPVSRKRIKARVTGVRTLLTHSSFRRLIQTAFVGFILYVAMVHVLAGESATNVTASPEAFCPFGGLETLYR